jgi:hypothetical protein
MLHEAFATALALLKASLAPMAVAVALVLLLRIFFGRREIPGWFSGVVIGVAYMLGHGTWQAAQGNSISSLVPSFAWTHEHWPLYLAPAVGVAAAAIGVLKPGQGWRMAAYAAIAIVAAWVLVPTWPNLWPSRAMCVPLLAAYFTALAALLERLADRVSPILLVWMLAATAGGVALLVSARSSLSYGQMAGIGAAAFAAVAVMWSLHWWSAIPVGLGLAFSVIIGGWAFIAAIYPNPPLFGYLLVTAAPLACWPWLLLRNRE